MSLERARQAALVQAALRGDEHAREELGALAEDICAAVSSGTHGGAMGTV